MQENAINIKCLYKGFKGRHVLKGVTLQVTPGEYFRRVEMNRAGKTGFIESPLNFCQLDQGSNQIFDAEHRLSVVQQQFACLPERFAGGPGARREYYAPDTLERAYLEAIDTEAGSA
jgi:ABC-type uncharacterized transport system ATPase subunit